MRPIALLLAASVSGTFGCSIVLSAAPPRPPAEAAGRPGEAAARKPGVTRVVALPVRMPDSAGRANTAELEIVYTIDPLRSKAGWVAEPRGVQLVSSYADGPFPRAGVPVRSIVVAVNGRRVVTERELIAVLQDQPRDSRVEVEFLDPTGASRKTAVELADESRRLMRFRIPFLVNYEREPLGSSTFRLFDLGLLSFLEVRRGGGTDRLRLLRVIELGGD